MGPQVSILILVSQFAYKKSIAYLLVLVLGQVLTVSPRLPLNVNPPVSVSQVLGLQAWAQPLSFVYWYNVEFFVLVIVITIEINFRQTTELEKYYKSFRKKWDRAAEILNIWKKKQKSSYHLLNTCYV
jgi:predicted membrane chloride channel (bestrophin family)